MNNEINKISLNGVEFSIPGDPPNIYDLINEQTSSGWERNIALRRNLFRGKSLGTSVTEEQYNSIFTGRFDDMFLGDYWSINGIDWQITDFDYWLGKGDIVNENIYRHHLVITPYGHMMLGNMNDTDTTVGGYVNSKMRTVYISEINSNIENIFGSGHIYEHRSLLPVTVYNGAVVGADWFTSKAEIPNEIMIYGYPVHQNNWILDGTYKPYLYDTDSVQLALFKICPTGYINPARRSFWLRDIFSETEFALCGPGGFNYFQPASSIDKIVPVFGIC